MKITIVWKKNINKNRIFFKFDHRPVKFKNCLDIIIISDKYYLFYFEI